MQNAKSSLHNPIAVILSLIVLAACAPFNNKTSTSDVVQLSMTPSLLAEWSVGWVSDLAWSPDSKVVAVNYHREHDESNNYVQAFDVESHHSIWTAKNSLAMDLVFTAEGHFIVESNTFAPFFYWRSIKTGEVVHQGEFTDISQIKEGDCNGGGQIILANARDNTALIVDVTNLIGLYTNHTVIVLLLDLETGKCKRLFHYQGSFDLFDLNTNGTLLAFGGEGEADSAVIWDVQKQVEVCRTPNLDFGRFVPGEDTLAVVRSQKIIFIDASTCKVLRELKNAPAFGSETSMAFSPDGKQLAIARDGVQILDVSTGETLAQIHLPENAIQYSSKVFFGAIKFSPDGRYLSHVFSTGIGTSKIQVWQLKR